MNRNKLEKQKEVREIIEKLSELKLTTIYQPIKDLFQQLKEYINNDSDVTINIKFPDIHKNIEGYLPINKKRQCWIRLTNSK